VQELQLTTGERGCAASHVMVWQRCCAWRKPVLVLEVGPSGSFDIFQREVSWSIPFINPNSSLTWTISILNLLVHRG
jgi:hypothetical protein